MSKTNRTPLSAFERSHRYFWPDGEYAYTKSKKKPLPNADRKYFLCGVEDEDGMWFTALKDRPAEMKRLIYRLPEVLDGVAQKRPIWLTEGEADADALDERGCVSTTAEGGALKFGPTEAAWIRGADLVVVLMDDDEPGAADALKKVEVLARLDPAPEVHVYRAAVGKDVRDHFAGGLSLLDLVFVGPAELRQRAVKATPGAFRRAGYNHLTLVTG